MGRHGLALALAVSAGAHLVLLALPSRPSGAASPAAPDLQIALQGARAATPLPVPPPAEAAPPAAAPAIAAPAPPGLRPGTAFTPPYLPARDVDVLPDALYPIEPMPPEEARRRGLAGEVRLLVFINAAGGVDEVVVLGADPAGLFEAAARDAFAAARFTPARKGGQAVAVQLPVVLRFEPGEEAVEPSPPSVPDPPPAG